MVATMLHKRRNSIGNTSREKLLDGGGACCSTRSKAPDTVDMIKD